MIGRWSSTPEPMRPISGLPLTPEGALAVGLIWDLGATRDAIDIGAGNAEILDIVMRNRDEDGCHGWHNRIISRPGETPPEDRFDLPRGRYHALVDVEAAGRRTRSLFRIVCDLGIEEFRLESIPKLPKGL